MPDKQKKGGTGTKGSSPSSAKSNKPKRVRSETSDSEELPADGQPTLADINKSIQQILVAVTRSEERLAKLESSVSTLETLREDNTTLKERVASIEGNGRNHNLVFFGIPDSADETRSALFEVVSGEILKHFKLDEREVDKVTRLGKFLKDKIRPVLVTMVREKVRWQILSQKKALGKTLGPLVIKPDQSPEDRKNFGELKAYFIKYLKNGDPCSTMLIRNRVLYHLVKKTKMGQYRVEDGRVKEFRN